MLLAAVCVAIAGCTEDRFPVFVPGSSAASGEEPSNPVIPPPVVSPDPDWSRLTSSAHPRIIYTDADFEAIRKGISGNPVLAEIHNGIIAIATSSLTAADLERKLSGKRLLDVSRNAEERILSCAYAYKTTSDRRFLEKAEHDIVTVCNFSDWNARKHFLDVGEMAAGVALGYDWLYNELSDETKSLVCRKLNEFAFSPALGKVWNLDFYSAVNNWNQVCNGGLVCAALAVYEKDQQVAREIVDKAMQSNVAAMETMYSPDGNYPEGYSYWNYGTLYEALMLTAMETATGSDTGLSNIGGFSHTGKYMLYMESPLGQCFNYSDCAPSAVACLAQWYFAHKFNDLSLLYLEKDKIRSYRSSSESRLLPLVAYYAYKMNIESLDDITAPEESFFVGEGLTPVVLVHDSWTMDTSDKFLGIKGGKGNTSHAHLDAGRFVYDAFGVRWSADLGLQSYGTLEPYINLWNMNDGSERWTAFRYNNYNHSTLTVNNTYHRVAGEAKIEGIINDNGKKGAIVDMTGPLSNEAAKVRRTVWMEGDNLYVTDEITARQDKDADVRWTMVTRARPVIEYGAITLSSANRTLYLKTSSSTRHRPVLKTWSTVSSNSWDQANTGYYECGYELTVSKGMEASVTVCLTPEE